jgi:hypothetical protein
VRIAFLELNFSTNTFRLFAFKFSQVVNGYFREIDDLADFTWELKYAKNKSLGSISEVETLMKGKWKTRLIEKKLICILR